VADPADIAHLLRRTEFTARPARVAELTPLTLDQAVDNVLNFAANGDVSLPAQFATNPSTNGYQHMIDCHHWWIDRMATRARPFQEKMALFWHGHFCTEWDVVGRADAMMAQNQLFRTQALGNFRTLTQAMSIQPAMLIYLSNANNTSNAPNQNFARELLELFTLGVGNYTEDDIMAAARAWTGHNLNYTTYQYEFRANRHDTTNKTFFGTTKNWDGPDIVNEILRDNAAKKLVAAKFIAKKFWEFIAYPRPAQNIVDDLGTAFSNADLDIRVLVRAALLRPEFYSVECRQGLVRTPTDWIVEIMARTGMNAATVNVFSFGDRMGQIIFNPPNVAGWKNNSYYLTTSALSGRANVAKRIAGQLRNNNGYDFLYSMSVPQSVDHVLGVFGLNANPATRQSLIDAHQAERSASNGSNRTSVTNLLYMVMLTGEMNVG
jgi:uncharacterized protein (DUF1800 family)